MVINEAIARLRKMAGNDICAVYPELIKESAEIETAICETELKEVKSRLTWYEAFYISDCIEEMKQISDMESLKRFLSSGIVKTVDFTF